VSNIRWHEKGDQSLGKEFNNSCLQLGENVLGSLVGFVYFDLETCFAPQRRVLFGHLNF